SARHPAQVLREPHELEMPAPTVWPFVLALGSTLLFAGLLTSLSLSVLGAALAAVGCVGWFREVLPHEHEEIVRVVHAPAVVTTRRPIVERVPIAPGRGAVRRARADRAGPGAGLVARSDISGIRGCQGWVGRQRRHGGHRLRVWAAEGLQPLAPPPP